MDFFHGKLSRALAEERLNAKGKPGAFLIRQSELKRRDTYVLSFFGNTGINHFRITNVYGSYFIGGRQFESLSELINYYSSSSDLLAGERLLYPVVPCESVSQVKEKIAIAILPYTKLAQTDELSFNKGDMFIVQNDLENGWFWCCDLRSGQSGTVFSGLLEEVRGEIDPNEVFPWFHSQITKKETVEKLAKAGGGSWLIRPSDNSIGNYTLYFHVGSTVQRFLIVKNNENRYTMGGKYFDSLAQIVELYQREQLIEGHTLQFPVTKTMSKAQVSNRIDKPEDVYRAVTISREAVKIKQSNELKGWLSLKRGDPQKRWKNYYFVLKQADRHLYYFDKPQQTKPKGLIDLSYSHLYKTHESLFGRQSFLIVESFLIVANHFYIAPIQDSSYEELRTYERWINAIKKFTSHNQNQSDQDVYKVKRSLYLNIIEANSLKASQPYFVVSYNQDIVVAKTQVKSANSAMFLEDGNFVFDLPADVKQITIFMHSNNKKPKSVLELAQFTIDLNRIRSDAELIDHWFEFRTLTQQDILGYMRLKINYSCDIIMALNEYAALEDLLCDPNIEIISLLDQLCQREHIQLARALSNIFLYRKSSNIVPIFKSLIEREAMLADTTTLFRSSSLTTALIESTIRGYMCQTVLFKCLEGPVKKLLNEKICCELNPSKMESHNNSQKACENLQSLLNILDELVRNIYNSVACYPITVRLLFASMQQIVLQKYPNEPLARTTVVSAFLFLRLICPTILNPKHFNLINETPSENAIRNLTLVAKCLANLVETPKVSEMLFHF